jgi:hypothetical protein
MSSTPWVAGLHFIGSADTQASVQEVSDSFSDLVKEKLKNIEIYISTRLINGELDEGSDEASNEGFDEGFHEEVEGQRQDVVARYQYILSGIVQTDGFVKECDQESYWKAMVGNHFGVYGFTITHSFYFYDAFGTGSATVQSLEKIQDFLAK